jgi:hypothetical protein
MQYWRARYCDEKGLTVLRPVDGGAGSRAGRMLSAALPRLVECPVKLQNCRSALAVRPAVELVSSFLMHSLTMFTSPTTSNE